MFLHINFLEPPITIQGFQKYSTPSQAKIFGYKMIMPYRDAFYEGFKKGKKSLLNLAQARRMYVKRYALSHKIKTVLYTPPRRICPMRSRHFCQEKQTVLVSRCARMPRRAHTR
jgi:hypothetical protein